jgi:CBS domain containing-hemolysin-like protein
MGDGAMVLLAVLLLLGNAFFVGAEFALISARRSQIEPRAEAGSRVARTTVRAMENISLVIGVNQLGITVCSLVLGAVGEPAVAHLLEPLLHALHVPEQLLHPISFVVALLVVVSLHVVLGEMIPKNIALAGPERAALVLAPPIWAIVTVLRPLVVVVNAVARGVLALVGVTLKDEVSSTYTREEVAALVEESRGEGLLEAEEYDRLTGALGFTERTVEAVLMRPQTLSTVARGASPAEVEDLCAATGFSRFPVRDEDGSWLGYLHIKDVLETDPGRRARPVDGRWFRPFARVSHRELLHAALETLQRRGAHLALVLDDTGDVLGLATLEDVIEELVGEIRDAAHHDDAHPAPE